MHSFETRRRVPFTPRQMYDLVADVERYPQFMPLCEALVVRRRCSEGAHEVLIADMTVGYMAIRETFTTRVTLMPEMPAVDAEHLEGPFRRLENRWRFTAAGEGCDVDFHIAYEFKSLAFQMLVGGLFDRAFRKFAEAFEARARVVYGPRPV